jgi:type II secretory pathway component PulF
MALYTYRAVTAGGGSEKGSLQAASESEASAALRDRGLFPLDIRMAQHFRLDWRRLLRFGRGPSLSARQLATFLRQLATLLHATIPYDTALGLILQETTDLDQQRVLGDVRSRVVEGAYLADALGAHPDFFPHMVVTMARSGETSGALVTVLQRLASYYEESAKLRTRIASALVYPAFMTLFGLGAVSFMVTSVIPRISRLFDSFGATLPWPTRLLIGTSDVLTGYGWLILPLLIAAAYGVQRWLRTEPGRLWVDRMELRLPLLHVFRRKVILQRFTQTLATMLHSGVDLKVALEAARGVLGNRLYLAAMDRAIFDVQNSGLPLATALRRSGMFPEELCQMVAIGEETATLDAMLETVSGRLTQEVSAMVEGATALFEPVLIMIMGGVVGFIVLSMLLPMLQLNQLIH